EIDEIVFVVDVGEGDRIRYISQNRCSRGSGLGARGSGFGFPYSQTLVRRHVREQADPSLPARPLHLDGIERVAWSDAKRQDVVDARLKATRRLLFLVKLPPTAPQGHSGADAEAIGPRSIQLDLQEAVLREGSGVVPIDERCVVDVVHHQVERTVAIQVPVGRATPAIWPMSEKVPLPLLRWGMLRVN